MARKKTPYLGLALLFLGVFGEVGAKLYLLAHPTYVSQASVVQALGFDGVQLRALQGIVLLSEYGCYVALAGIICIFFQRLPS